LLSDSVIPLNGDESETTTQSEPELPPLATFRLSIAFGKTEAVTLTSEFRISATSDDKDGADWAMAAMKAAILALVGEDRYPSVMASFGAQWDAWRAQK